MVLAFYTWVGRDSTGFIKYEYGAVTKRSIQKTEALLENEMWLLTEQVKGWKKCDKQQSDAKRRKIIKLQRIKNFHICLIKHSKGEKREDEGKKWSKKKKLWDYPNL